MEIIGTILGYVDNPVAKYILTLVGGFILKANPDFPNRFIPILTGVCGLVITLAHGMFPTAAPLPAANAVALASVVAVPASIFSTIGISLLHDWLIPWLGAIGTHSAAKNTLQPRKA